MRSALLEHKFVTMAKRLYGLTFAAFPAQFKVSCELSPSTRSGVSEVPTGDRPAARGLFSSVKHRSRSLL